MKHWYGRIGQALAVAVIVAGTAGLAADKARTAGEPWVVYDGPAGPGKGKHIVLISGDEEYRSEEALPQLGKILAMHHGFKCTVLFAIDKETGTINPNQLDNIPGLDALKTADLMIISTRFRALPDDQMRAIDEYLKAGKPVLGMRTANHAFRFRKGSKWEHYSFRYAGGKNGWKGGFGILVFGEHFRSHHGRHGRESTRGIIAPGADKHPITRGIRSGDIWGPTDVYGVKLPLPGDSKPIILGQVLEGMKPDDPPTEAKRKNNPMMPVAWTRTYQLPGGKRGRAFSTSMGASVDLVSEGTRRMIVHGAYWCLGMEDRIPEKGTKVDIVGKFVPTRFGTRPNDYWKKKALRVRDFERTSRNKRNGKPRPRSI